MGVQCGPGWLHPVCCFLCQLPNYNSCTACQPESQLLSRIESKRQRAMRKMRPIMMMAVTLAETVLLSQGATGTQHELVVADIDP
eukprot:1153702-Pelagomonas_calceolata.AAC.12